MRRREAKREDSGYAVDIVKAKPPGDLVDLLCAILRDSSPLPGAACTVAPRAFDWDASPSEHKIAARVCLEACPVLDLCRQRAAQGDLSGIVAGVYYSVVPSLRHADPA
jgi:hypothetical protein